MKITNLLTIFITTIALLTGCNSTDMDKQVQQANTNVPENQTTAQATNQTNGNDMRTKEDIMKETIDKQKKKIEDLTDEVEFYRTYVKNLTATFSSDEMAKFIDEEWSYTLSIGDVSFPKNGMLEISSHSFEVKLTEERVPYSVIPDEISKKGKIGESLTNQVSFENLEYQPTTKENVNDTNSEIIYSFKDVSSGTNINIKITEALQKELKLDTNELTIHVK